MKARAAVISSSLVTLLALGSGCLGYRLGPTGGRSAGSRSVEVRLFDNRTPKPRLAQSVAFSLRQALQQDGTFRLASDGTGDLVVKGAITEFNREELSFQAEDALTVRDYTITMAAEVRAIDSATGETNLQEQVESRTTLRVGNDLTSAERQGVPRLAEELARDITTRLVDGTW